MSSLAYPLYARCLQTELCMRLVDVRNRASDRPPVEPVPDGRKSKGPGASGLEGVPMRGPSSTQEPTSERG